MSGYTYYQYRDVKVLIAHRLFKMDGWTVYGYYADNSDPYTDYYDPAYWNGIATKNGYTLVVDHSTAQEERRHTYKVQADYSPEIAEKIRKLEKMTTANGASEAEEATAKAAISKLMEKQTAGEVTKEDYTPGHMANPPRCNWHIEKDGIIYDKGTGILKFSDVPDITNEGKLKAWQDFNNQTKEEYINKYITTYTNRWNATKEEAAKQAEYSYKRDQETYALLDQFNILINRFNTVAGGMVGNSGEDGYTYQNKKITKYRKVYKVQETNSGSFKAGQCFILKHSFNYARHAGTVYRFMQFGENSITGQRVSLKSNKTLTGLANSQNRFGHFRSDEAPAPEYPERDREKFLKWIESGSIAWCEVVEVQEPYEVDKCIKVDANGNEYKPTKAAKKAPEETANAAPAPAEIQYIITPDTDTRDNSSLYVVTLAERVSRDKFEEIRKYISSIGGYYSRFKRGFIFREDPTEALTGEAPEGSTPEEAAPENPTPEEAAPDEVTTKAPATDEAPKEEPAPEEVKTIPLDAPEKPKKTVYGYTGGCSEFFTPEEIQNLVEGQQLHKGEKWEHAAYFTTTYKDNIKFVYSIHIGDQENMRPGSNANFCGFIYSGKYYTDFKAITAEIEDDINTELLTLIPTEEAASRNAVDLDKYELEKIENYKTYDFKREALRHFIDDTTPELFIYSNLYRHNGYITQEDAINYLIDPLEVIAKFVTAYKKSHRVQIYEEFIKYNKIVTEYNRILLDKNDPAHMLKAIREATKDGDEKTYKILLTNGNTVQVEAYAVRNLAYCNYISSYNVKSTYKQYLNKDERGREEDIKPEDIVNIMHGFKTLYQAATSRNAA